MEFYGGISCDRLKRKEVRQLPFKPAWLYGGKGMLAPSCLLESHSCRLSWPGIWVVLAPIISDRKETAVPGGFPTEPGHRESVQYHNRRKHREEIEKKKFWEKRIFKLKLVWTSFCSILCCSFTFSQISDLFLTFVAVKLTFFFSSSYF